jgi:hypothetical protein
MRNRIDFSPKLLAAFLAFVVGRELFHLSATSSEWIANLVGLALWSLVMYVVPPRTKLWRVLLATASLVLIVIALRLLHVG